MPPISKKTSSAGSIVESIVGCKWSIAVLDAVASGVHRPSGIQRACPGISTKVLNERLRKLVGFGLVERESFPETPPRVEYRLTTRGQRFGPVLEAVRAFQSQLDAEAG